MTIFTKTKGAGDEIVLLHGVADDHAYMLPIMEQLSKRYHVTTLDEPGCGNSPWQSQIKDVHDLVDTLLPVLPERATYIGSSFGGSLAISLAARYPERVKRIITIGSSPKFIEASDWPGIPAPGLEAAIFPLIEGNGIAGFLKNFHDDEFADFPQKLEAYHQLNQQLDNMKTDLPFGWKSFFIFLDYSHLAFPTKFYLA